MLLMVVLGLNEPFVQPGRSIVANSLRSTEGDILYRMVYFSPALAPVLLTCTRSLYPTPTHQMPLAGSK